MKFNFNFNLKRSSLRTMMFVLLGVCVMHPALASSVDLPFNSALDTLQQALLGKAMFALATIMTGVTMFMLAFVEWSDGMKRILQMTFFLSLALAAPSAISTLFGSSGALC